MAACLLGALAARAHSVRHPKQVALLLERGRVQVAIDLEIPAGPKAQALRQAFDADRNGRLDAQEQERLVAFLAAEAARGTRLSLSVPVPGWRGFFLTRFDALPLVPRSPPRGERTDDVVASDALLAVKVLLSADLARAGPRRSLKLEDDSSAVGGHVPIQVACVGCQIVSSTLGVSAQDPRGDHVLGAEVAPAQPLVLELRFP